MPTKNFMQPMERTVEMPAAEIIPGPGHYNTGHGRDSRLSNTIISSSFQKPSKEWGQDDVTPGPGDYENNFIQQCKENRPAYTVRSKPKLEPYVRNQPISISLGPAEYIKLSDPLDISCQTAPWKAPVERKVRKAVENTPGPGDYLSEKSKDVTLLRHPTHKLGLKGSTLGGPFETGTSPGPAYYHKDGFIGKGLAKSISAKDLVVSDRNVGKESTTPGPGAYLKHSSSQPILSRRPAYTWAAKQHTNSNAVGRRQFRRNPVVGPGKYEADPNHTHKRSPAHVIVGRPKKAAWGIAADTPGPNFMPSDKYSKLYTMQGKNDYHERTSDIYRNPGPGHYNDHKAWNDVKNEKRYDKRKGATMAKKYYKKATKDIRKVGLTHDAPTAIASKSKRSAAYTMQGRYKPRADIDQPGPGHYMVKSTMFNSTPKKRL